MDTTIAIHKVLITTTIISHSMETVSLRTDIIQTPVFLKDTTTKTILNLMLIAIIKNHKIITPITNISEITITQEAIKN